MKNKTLILLLTIISLTLIGCDSRHRQPPTKEKVAVYKVKNDSAKGDDDAWVYWYMIYDNNVNSYYYAQSSSLVSSYSKLNWQKSEGPPENFTEEEEISENEVPSDELGNAETEIQSDFSSIPENNSLDSMEGVDSSPSSSSESGSSDGGSSGGDSGGGGGD